MEIPNLAADETPAGGEEDFVVLETHRDAAGVRLRAARPRRARPDARRDRPRARRQGVGLALLLPDRHRRPARVRADQHGDGPGPRQRLHPGRGAVLVKPRAMEGTGFLGQAADDVYRIEGQDLYLVGTSEVPMAAYHSDEILDAATLPLAVRRVQPVLPQGGRLARQGHPRHLPRALVRQGRDVRLHDARGLVRRAPAPAGVGEGVPRQARALLPRDRRRRRRPRSLRPAEVRLRGVDRQPAAATASSRRPPTAPTSRPGDSTPGAGSPTARSARSPPSTARSARPTGRSSRCSRPTSRRTARCACPRHCGPTSVASRCSSRSRRRGRRGLDELDRRVVAAPAGRARHRRHPAQVGRGRRHDVRADQPGRVRRGAPRAGRRRTRRARQRTVAARHDPGRRPARPAPGRRASGCGWWRATARWSFRYPPLEVVHEETFDAAPAVAAVLEHHPSALVAVEERGVGYRVNRPLPDRRAQR